MPNVSYRYHRQGNGGVERVDHALGSDASDGCQRAPRDGWDTKLPRVGFPCNNSVSAAAGLAPNEVCMNAPPPRPLPPHYHRAPTRHTLEATRA